MAWLACRFRQRAAKPRLCSLLAIGLLACQGAEPPGNQQSGRETVASAALDELVSAEASPASTATGHGQVELGSAADNLPFSATGEKLASIAWRTWIYTDTGPKRTRYGYLRAGQVVDRRGPPIVNAGCAGGWYRINPRGFVCVGKGATLDLEHPVVVATRTRAKRGEGLPYVYALSDERSPHFYFKLPTRREVRATEGAYEGQALTWVAARKAKGQLELLGLQDQPPDFLRAWDKLTKPYGTEQRLHFVNHAGRASSDSGFAILETFLHENRAWGLTTELDLIPMDRTKLVVPSELSGVVLGPTEELPVAVVTGHWVTKYERADNGALRSAGAYPRRTLLKLTGEKLRDGATYWQTADEHFVAEVGLRIISPREQFPSVATGSRKWIDISISHQTLVAYEGTKPVFVTLVSTGLGGLGDPEKVPATIQGTFMVHAKHVSSTMNGEEDKSDSFNLLDVPFVQYFHKGFALHAAYWHDDFGRWRSHGCVNLAPRDAAWLFEWTDPHVPEGWHAVINKDRGSVVHIHP